MKKSSAHVSRMFKEALEAFHETEQHDIQGQIAGIGPAADATGPEVLWNPVVKVLLCYESAQLPGILQTYKLFSAVLAMQLTSTLVAHNEVYRAVLNVTEAPQRGAQGEESSTQRLSSLFPCFSLIDCTLVC